ncbi:MAG: AI-2E family transporter [Candidatus Sericytochromatia bacterium]|nr:AI-2E family transporter [Candidatus Sericytochromatia bacterium]
MPPSDEPWSRRFHHVGTVALWLGLAWMAQQALSYLGDTVAILVAALLLAYVLQMAVDPLSRRMSRFSAILVVLLGVVTVLVAIGYLFVPLVVHQVQELINALPGAVGRLEVTMADLQEALAHRNIRVRLDPSAWLLPRIESVTSWLTGNLGGVVASGVLNLFNLAMTLVCAFYLMKDGNKLWAEARPFLPQRWWDRLDALGREMDRGLAGYFRGQLINASIVLVAAMVAFNLPPVQMRYGVVAAAFWGLCEIVPMFGSYVGIGTAVLLALLEGGGIWWKALVVAVIIQQIRDNLISPRVMAHTTGLHPVVIIMAILAGTRLAGLLGLLLAIPFAAVAAAALRAWVASEAAPSGWPVPSADADPTTTVLPLTGFLPGETTVLPLTRPLPELADLPDSPAVSAPASRRPASARTTMQLLGPLPQGHDPAVGAPE